MDTLDTNQKSFLSNVHAASELYWFYKQISANEPLAKSPSSGGRVGSRGILML
jgi:hypothetical protein